MINVNKLHPNLCKHGSCLQRALYEFTDVKTTKPDGSVAEHKETIILGHACENHVEEVNKLLKEIHYGDKESDDIQ